jgi:hypothetical protein
MFAPIPVNPTSLSPAQAQQQQPMAVYPPQSTQDGLPAPIPVMRDVREEAEIARCNARLLVEALAFTQPAEMETNEIIQVSLIHSPSLILNPSDLFDFYIRNSTLNVFRVKTN